MYAISKCAFLLGFCLEFRSKKLEENHQKSTNVNVERGVATRRAQMVWPSYDDSYCDKF